MANNGINANDIAKLGGWKDVALVMRRYIHTNKTHEDAMAVFEKVGVARRARS